MITLTGNSKLISHFDNLKHSKSTPHPWLALIVNTLHCGTVFAFSSDFTVPTKHSRRGEREEKENSHETPAVQLSHTANLNPPFAGWREWFRSVIVELSLISPIPLLSEEWKPVEREISELPWVVLESSFRKTFGWKFDFRSVFVGAFKESTLKGFRAFTPAGWIHNIQMYYSYHHGYPALHFMGALPLHAAASRQDILNLFAFYVSQWKVLGEWRDDERHRAKEVFAAEAGGAKWKSFAFNHITHTFAEPFCPRFNMGSPHKS